jgi:hypothetical protein
MDDLEQIIRTLVNRKKRGRIRLGRLSFLRSQLAGLRYSYEEAGGIIEEFDPHWGEECSPP